MIKSYLTVAVRNLFRQKAYTAINVLGLAIGLMSVILIGLYIAEEVSYDTYHENVDRVHYRDAHRSRPVELCSFEGSRFLWDRDARG